MTIILEVSTSDHRGQQSNSQSSSGISKSSKHNASKSTKETKLKNKNEKKSNKKLSSASSQSTSTTNTSSSPISIKNSLIDNKEKLNDLNDQILNSQQLHQQQSSHHHHHHHRHQPQRHESSSTRRHDSLSSRDYQSNFNPSHHKSESIMSSDSDIRFTRKKLGDNQRCGCIVITGFLVALLIAGLVLYAAFIFLQSKPLPNRIFRGRIRIIEGDRFTMNLTDQNSIEFLEKSRDYRERINLLISRSQFRKFYDGCEVLALDGHIFDDRNLKTNDLIVHFLLNFDPHTDQSYVGVEELRVLFVNEFQLSTTAPNGGKFFNDLKMDLADFQLKEIIFGKFDDLFATSSAPLENDGRIGNVVDSEEIRNLPPRTCVPMKVNFCKQIGYNMTTYPNLLGHHNWEEIEKDLITFRELVDSECFLQAYDFLCHLLQPPCELALDAKVNEIYVQPRFICRSYCQSFIDGCLSRIPQKFKNFFDCERFPEQSAMQSCRHRPSCVGDMKALGQGQRICDGVADCPNLEDEVTCSFCPANALYCGRGRACISREMRCDGKFDCPDGSDEKDCLSIAPLVEHLTKPKPLIPHRPQFYHEGFAVFSEKGQTGKLCAEGMESNSFVRSTVAESLCKALGYEKVTFADIRNDTESNQNNYVRVLDPRAAEISFVRTNCGKGEAFYLGCSQLECGRQTASSSNGLQLPKMAAPGDWPFHVALFRKDTHVCDGTLISAHWVLTTISCFQGQSRATWMAVFGNVRIGVTAPWTQRRRIIGMVVSPVEGSTAALIRLQTPVVFSDFVRPVCLPDDESSRHSPETDYQSTSSSALHSGNLPRADKLQKISKRADQKFTEDRQYFRVSDSEKEPLEDVELPGYKDIVASGLVDENLNSLKPEPFKHSENYNKNPALKNQWQQCNTLGWSRQREHLQRVQLKHIDMKACENISIATVNSLCGEAVYHKQDCNEEEFAGSPIVCLLSDEKRWALVGVSSWRIACTHSGTERPRMYDKIESNVGWIREIINSVI